MANNVEYILSLKDLFTGNLKRALAGTDQLDAKMNKLQSTASSVGGALGKAFAVLGAGIFAKSIFDTGKQFELYEVGLKTFLKSNEEAARVFGNIKNDAAKTPFEVDALFKGNLALISAGESADVARTNVLGLANAISATGGGNDELQRMVSNLQQIKNTGIATSADIRQFGYAGINIYGALAAATGKSKDEVKNMKVSYELLTFALNKAAGAGGIFEGAMANAMNTVEGKFSNLKDTITFLKDKIFRDFKNSIIIGLDSISNGIEFVSDLFTFLKNNINLLKGVFQPLTDVVIYLWDTLIGVFKSFNIGEMFLTWANAIGGLLYVLKPFAIVLIDVLGFALKAVVGIANGIALIVKGVANIFGYTDKKFDGKKADNGVSNGSTQFGGFNGAMGSTSGYTAKGKKGDGLGSSVSSVSGSRPTSIVINISKLVETQNFDGSATANIKSIAPKVKEEMIKVFMMMMNDSQQLTTV